MLGAGNYEYVRLQSDGNNFRIVSSTRNTRLANGFEPPPWPSNWIFPTSSGYAAELERQRQRLVELQQRRRA